MNLEQIALICLNVVLIPIGLATIRLLIVQARQSQILIGNGRRGLCGDVESHGRQLSDIEKNCVIHHSTDDGRDLDVSHVLKQMAHIVAVAQRQQRDAVVAPGTDA